MSFDHCFINSLTTSFKKPRSSTRKALLKLYKHCLVTGWTNPADYECAHIVPRSVGLQLGYPTTDHTDNFMFLCSSLHSLFDSMLWSFEVPPMESFDTKSSSFTAKLVANPKAASNSILQNYTNEVYEIPSRNYCSLYVHHQVYLHGVTYLTAMNEPAFQLLYKKMTSL